MDYSVAFFTARKHTVAFTDTRLSKLRGSGLVEKKSSITFQFDYVKDKKGKIFYT